MDSGNVPRFVEEGAGFPGSRRSGIFPLPFEARLC